MWFVVRLVVNFQSQFYDRAVAELAKARGEIEARDKIIEELRRQVVACMTERGALRATVRQSGLQWNPSDWGSQDDR